MSASRPVTLTFRVAIKMTPEQARAWADEYGRNVAEVHSDLAQYIETGLQGNDNLSPETGGTESITVTPTGQGGEKLAQVEAASAE